MPGPRSPAAGAVRPTAAPGRGGPPRGRAPGPPGAGRYTDGPEGRPAGPIGRPPEGPIGRLTPPEGPIGRLTPPDGPIGRCRGAPVRAAGGAAGRGGTTGRG